MSGIESIKNKYKYQNWLFGQYIPPDEKENFSILFIGEKPSEYFKRHEDRRYLGNYNVTATDFRLHGYIKKYGLGRIYITDMVKTEGKAGADFVTEWHENPIYKKCLQEELDILKPALIVLMGRRVENLFKSSFPENNELFFIYHPAYVTRYNKYDKWEVQFKKIQDTLK